MRTCEHCGTPLPEGSSASKRFCDRRCVNAAYRAAHKVPADLQRAYALKHYRKKRAALLAAIGERLCVECGTLLPPESRLRRKFCSRRCINQRSLREKRYERVQAARRRRSQIIGPGVTADDWQRLLARHGSRCVYCGASGTQTMDHVVPISRGGWDAIGNILPACRSCNASKGDRLLVEWRRDGRTRLAA